MSYPYCQKCIDAYSSMDDEPYLCGIRPCPLVKGILKECI